MNHKILTRFNWKFGFSPIDLVGKTQEGMRWLDSRMELYGKYYLPSIINQSEQNFSVVTLCDPETPRSILDEIAKYSEIIHEPFKSWIKKQKGPLLTSRLDSDDAINLKYVETIQKEVSKLCSKKSEEPLLIDCQIGYYIPRERATGHVKHIAPSQFISVYSPDNSVFVYSREHPRMRECIKNYYKHFDFIGGLHIVHGENASIKHINYKKRSLIDLKDFGIFNE